MFIEGKFLYMMFVQTLPYKPQYSFVFLNAVSYLSDNLANDVEALFVLLIAVSCVSENLAIDVEAL